MKISPCETSSGKQQISHAAHPQPPSVLNRLIGFYRPALLIQSAVIQFFFVILSAPKQIKTASFSRRMLSLGQFRPPFTSRLQKGENDEAPLSMNHFVPRSNAAPEYGPKNENLVQSGRAVGFSGKADCFLILPLPLERPSQPGPWFC